MHKLGQSRLHVRQAHTPSTCCATFLKRGLGSSFSPVCATVTRVFLQQVGKLIRANLFSSLCTKMPGRTCWRSVPQREMFLIIFTHLIWEVHRNPIIAVITRSRPCRILQQLCAKLSEAPLAFLFFTKSPQTMFQAIQRLSEMSCWMELTGLEPSA